MTPALGMLLPHRPSSCTAQGGVPVPAHPRHLSSQGVPLSVQPGPSLSSCPSGPGMHGCKRRPTHTQRPRDPPAWGQGGTRMIPSCSAPAHIPPSPPQLLLPAPARSWTCLPRERFPSPPAPAVLPGTPQNWARTGGCGSAWPHAWHPASGTLASAGFLPWLGGQGQGVPNPA